MVKVRRMLTEVLLEVTTEEMQSVAEDAFNRARTKGIAKSQFVCKAKWVFFLSYTPHNFRHFLNILYSRRGHLNMLKCWMGNVLVGFKTMILVVFVFIYYTIFGIVLNYKQFFKWDMIRSQVKVLNFQVPASNECVSWLLSTAPTTGVTYFLLKSYTKSFLVFHNHMTL